MPGSGAYARGQSGDIEYSGDIKASKNGYEKLFELKTRKAEFGLIYNLITALRYFDATGIVETGVGTVVFFGSAPEDTHEGRAVFSDVVAARFPGFKRTMAKVFRMQKLLKGADYLVVKNDRMSHIFIRYS